jgi:hypothetical protein
MRKITRRRIHVVTATVQFEIRAFDRADAKASALGFIKDELCVRPISVTSARADARGVWAKEAK